MRIERTIHNYAIKGHAARRWYVHARLVVGCLARLTDQPIGRCADVLAITSPRMSVQRNLKVAYTYLAGQGFMPDVTRSTRIAIQHYESTGEIRGPKTSAFAKALRGDNNVCVVDSHIARAFGYSEHVARSLYVRVHVTRVVRMIARRQGLTVAECQACVWAGYYRATFPRGKVPKYRIREIELDNVPY